MSAVKAIPEGYRSITPYLIVKGGVEAMAFYSKSFGATEALVLHGPDGKIGHAELIIGDSKIMLADENEAAGAKSPQTVGGASISIHLYVEDVDSVVTQAIAAGGTLMHPVTNQFYGDRSGSLIDPFGHHWHIATHIEDLSPEEIEARAKTMMHERGKTCNS